jgi:prephenate dehydratase
MIGYQGEPHSNSYQACHELFPEADNRGYLNFPSAFQALEDGQVDRLVLPIENSTTGSILPVLDRLIAGGVTIVAEHLLKIHYAVFGIPGATINDLTTVHSHPEALRQAEASLVDRGWDPMPEHDTAGAVRLVAERGDVAHGALAPERAATAYGLDVLLAGVVDKTHNTTRFVVLESGEASFPADGNKTTVAFEGAHTPGSLALALTELGLRGANLTRIESRPSDEAWKYRFFVDLIHKRGKVGYDEVFDPMPVTMQSVFHLGTYPAAT